MRLATSQINRITNAWLTGAIPKSDFAVPYFRFRREMRSRMQFRGPNFYETNINFYKDTRITERVNFEFRFELFNIFNRANYDATSTPISRMEISAKRRHRMSRDSGNWEASSRSSLFDEERKIVNHGGHEVSRRPLRVRVSFV